MTSIPLKILIDSHLLYVNHQAKRNQSTFCTNEEVALLSKAGLSTKDITEVINTKLSLAGIQCKTSYQQINYKRNTFAPVGSQESPSDILTFLKQKQETCGWKFQLNTDNDQRLQSIFWISPNMAYMLQQNADVVLYIASMKYLHHPSPQINRVFFGHFAEIQKHGQCQFYQMLRDISGILEILDCDARFKLFINGHKLGFALEGSYEVIVKTIPKISKPADQTKVVSINNFHSKECVGPRNLPMGEHWIQRLPCIFRQQKTIPSQGQVKVFNADCFGAHRKSQGGICLPTTQYHSCDNAFKSWLARMVSFRETCI
ncbi:hypothetical protein MIR68_000510 [Amoeboaphelidium protococcarum]|nr:hypothetical protein MIR68_000510 [Amoeboaphelidium protococcarum]